MYSMTLNGSPNDTFSTPYPDFAADGAVFVGDDSGKLHKFTGVFNGTPGEVTGGSPSWPVTVNSGVKITSPVYDPGTGKVFVGDAQGILHSVTAGGSINGTSSSLGDIIIDGPLVDSNAGTVYVFVTTNSAGDNAVFQFNTSFTSGIGNGAATGTEVGTGGTGYYLYVGAFDNVYYESSNHSGNLYIVGVTGGDPGLLYQIPILGIANFTSTGTPSSNSTNVTITGTAVTSADDGMQITDTTHPACIPANDTISSVSGSTVTLTTKTSSSGGCASGDALAISNMGAPVSVKISGDTGMGATDSHLAPWPSPITEFCNNGATGCALNAGGTATTSGTDYIFVSVERGGDSQATSPPCIDSESDGCIAAINVSNPSSITLSGASNFTTGSNPSAGCWWTGGIVIDNSVGSGTLAGASQVYFINLAGNSAGGAVVATSCGAAVTGNTIQAVQASQSLP
jgi:hypothetical protein